MMSTQPAPAVRFYDLDEFTRSYIGAALWSSMDDDGEPLDSVFDGSDIAPESLAQMADDCNQFRTGRTVHLLRNAYTEHNFSDEQAGLDFWLTRNRHGAGFWDRGLGVIGERLSDDAHAFGSCDLYVGDDGSVYLA